MVKASSNVVSLEFYNKSTNKKEKTFDQILRIAKFIGRADNKTKNIGNKNTKFLLTHIADRINRSKTGVIFIDHYEISEITETDRRQNTNIISQLTDVFNFEYHRFIIFEGERKHYGYKVYFTDDGIERINNPETFYPELFNKKFQSDRAKSCAVRGKKLPYVAQKITSHKEKNCTIHAQVQYSNLDIINIKRDILDIPSNYVLNLSQEGQNHENQGHNFSFSNQGAYEVQKDSNKETQLSRSRPLQEPQGVITSQVKQYSSQQALVQTRDVNGSYHNKLLKDFKFTDELLDTVRRLSNKPDISIDRIKVIIRKIVTNNPETEIWGGNKAFVNYVVRAVNNEKEYSKKVKASSIAEMDKKAREKAALMYENKTIEFFN